jgi:hypothetical protein
LSKNKTGLPIRTTPSACERRAPDYDVVIAPPARMSNRFALR